MSKSIVYPNELSKPIIAHPNDALRSSSAAVEPDENVDILINDMILSMYARHGIGLAAIQIGIAKRVIVADLSEMKSPPIVMINPKIVYRSIATSRQSEGCLSLPGVEGVVERPNDIIVEYHDQDRAHRVQALDGLLARCVQHEVDHLDGIMFFDHLSAFARRRLMDRYNRR